MKIQGLTQAQKISMFLRRQPILSSELHSLTSSSTGETWRDICT